MHQTLPRVTDRHLYLPETGDEPIAVGSCAWYEWLETHTSFAFADAHGTFTARKSHAAGTTSLYWKAYRKRGGKLKSCHLGRSHILTLDRLQSAARLLAEQAPATRPPELETEERTHDTLMRTKFFMPPPHPQRVERPQLFARLRDDVHQPLILVVAPAGYGKTSLLADWITADQRTAAWLSLEPGDNDPIRFWRAVISSLENLQPGVAKHAGRLLQSSPPPPVEALQPILLNNLAERLNSDGQGRPVLLVLDDYHLIEQRVIHETLATFLERLPPQLRLVIASRADPVLPLARLRVRRQVVETRSTELALNGAEVAAFLADTVGVHLDEEIVTALTERTEGWVAALQLVTLSLRGHANPAGFLAHFRGSDRLIVAYLVEEVLRHQPEHVQQFLLHTCILDRMCAELCNAVRISGQFVQLPAEQLPEASFAQLDAQVLLDYLEAANLFVVALDAEGRWYRYHHLFAEVLRHRLNTLHPGLEITLRRRAYAWFERAGYMRDAIDLALAGHDWEMAARLIEREADGTWGHGDYATLERWLDSLPESLVRVKPHLSFARLVILNTTFRLCDVAPVLADLEYALAHKEEEAACNRPDQVSLPTATLRARILVERSYLTLFLQGDVPHAHTQILQALALLPSADDHWLATAQVMHAHILWKMDKLEEARLAYARAPAHAKRADNLQMMLNAINNHARILCDLGNLRAADRMQEEGYRIAVAMGAHGLPVMHFRDLVVARILYERNEVAEAERACLRGIERAGQARNGLWQGLAYLQLSQIRQAQGNGEAATRSLVQAERILIPDAPANPLGSSWTQRMLAAYHARLQGMHGDLEAVSRWAEETERTDPACIPLGDRSERVFLLMQARACLLQGRAEQALERLTPLHARAEAIRSQDALLEILLLETLALERSGRHPAALEQLCQALTLGASEGYVRTFLDEGAPLMVLLQKLAHDMRSASTLLGYIQHLLDAFDAERGVTDNNHSTASSTTSPLAGEHAPALVLHPLSVIEPLSTREREVLLLMTEGLSNQAIAERLIVSLSTVKWHIGQIHGKLGVQSRTQAIALARDLSLLP